MRIICNTDNNKHVDVPRELSSKDGIVVETSLSKDKLMYVLKICLITQNHWLEQECPMEAVQCTFGNKMMEIAGDNARDFAAIINLFHTCGWTSFKEAVMVAIRNKPAIQQLKISDFQDTLQFMHIQDLATMRSGAGFSNIMSLYIPKNKKK